MGDAAGTGAFGARSGATPALIYVLFVLLTCVQVGVFLVSGALSHVSVRGSGIMLLLLVALALRSRFVWALLVLINAVQLGSVMVLSIVGAFPGFGRVQWGHSAAMLMTGAALEATLLSPAMRRFVRRPSRQADGDGQASLT